MKRRGQQKLTIIPISWREACAFIKEHHRHNKPPRGQKFALAVIDESGRVRGVATCGRSVARALDDRFTLEVNRTCTDGFPNANSCLYSACVRVASAMGYHFIHTDIQETESGVSLKAANWESTGKIRKPRKNWAQSSKKLRHLRDNSEPSNVPRVRWFKKI